MISGLLAPECITTRSLQFCSFSLLQSIFLPVILTLKQVMSPGALERYQISSIYNFSHTPKNAQLSTARESAQSSNLTDVFSTLQEGQLHEGIPTMHLKGQESRGWSKLRLLGTLTPISDPRRHPYFSYCLNPAWAQRGGGHRHIATYRFPLTNTPRSKLSGTSERCLVLQSPVYSKKPTRVLYQIRGDDLRPYSALRSKLGQCHLTQQSTIVYMASSNRLASGATP